MKIEQCLCQFTWKENIKDLFYNILFVKFDPYQTVIYPNYHTLCQAITLVEKLFNVEQRLKTLVYIQI